MELRGAVPRTSMGEHYAWGNVFLLPSITKVGHRLLRGFGLPSTTPKHGKRGRDGIDGFVVPIRDGEQSPGRVQLLAEKVRELLAWMSANATARHREFTVDTVAAVGERVGTVGIPPWSIPETERPSCT